MLRAHHQHLAITIILKLNNTITECLLLLFVIFKGTCFFSFAFQIALGTRVTMVHAWGLRGRMLRVTVLRTVPMDRTRLTVLSPVSSRFFLKLYRYSSTTISP